MVEVLRIGREKMSDKGTKSARRSASTRCAARPGSPRAEIIETDDRRPSRALYGLSRRRDHRRRRWRRPSSSSPRSSAPTSGCTGFREPHAHRAGDRSSIGARSPCCVVGVVLVGGASASCRSAPTEVVGSLLRAIGIPNALGADRPDRRVDAVGGALPAHRHGDSAWVPRSPSPAPSCRRSSATRSPSRASSASRRVPRSARPSAIVARSSPPSASWTIAVLAFAGGLARDAARLRRLPRERPHRGRDPAAHRHRGQRLRRRRARVPAVRRRHREPRADRVLAARLAQRLAAGARSLIVARRRRRRHRRRASCSAAATTCSRSASATPATSASTSSALRIGSIVLVALLTGAAVAFCGIIAFVGLVVPHIIRMAIGPVAPRRSSSRARSAAALLMVVADLLARTLVPGRRPADRHAHLAHRRAVLLLPAVPAAPAQRGLGMTAHPAASGVGVDLDGATVARRRRPRGRRPARCSRSSGPTVPASRRCSRCSAASGGRRAGAVRSTSAPLDELSARSNSRACAVVLTQENAVGFPFRVREVVAMGRSPWARTPESRRRCDGDRRRRSRRADVAHLLDRRFT